MGFLKWLDHFIAFTKPTKEHKVILMVDGHVSHKSVAVVEKARDSGVVIIASHHIPHTESSQWTDASLVH